MNRTDKDKIVCDNCEFQVSNDDDFCANCGGLFIENVKCEIHPGVNAAGVCAICMTPVCKSCAGRLNDCYLCKEHSHYEIIEGMARIYGTNDFALAEFTIASLKQGGFHPYNFSRKTSPISMGGVDYSLYRASGEFNGHLINELKIMVPLWEVLDAQKLLGELNISE